MHIQSLYRHPSRTPFSPPYTGRMDAPTVGSGRGTKKRPIRPGGQATDASVTRTGPNASKKDNYKAAMNSQSNSYDNIKPSGGLADCNDSGVLFVKRSPCSVALFSPSKQSDIAETAAALLDKEYQSVPQDVDIIVEEEICCFICNQNLSLHDMASREAHVNACLDGSATEPQSFPEAPAAIAIEIDISEEGTTPSEHADLEHIGGLRAAELCCVVCGLDISRRGMFSRCFHIKRCARENMISVKDIIRMLSDHDDISGTADAEDVVEIIDCSDNSKATDINSMLMRNARHTVKDTSASASCSSIDKDIMRQMKQSAEAKNVNNFLMSAARENAGASKRRADEAEAAAGSREAKRGRNGWGKRQWNSNSSGNNAKLATNGAAEAYLQDGYAPDYKKIQYDGIEVPIIVDGFQYASTALSDTYFLTHFHSDHYGGLSSSFNCGKIYCSPATAALTQLRLRVSPHSLAPLALEVKHTVVVGGSKVFVTLIEANHCPGAVLLLFEFRSGKKILHTGDFRYNRDMLVRSPAMRELARSPSSNMRNLIVYLDTTYCDPQYCFPDQSLAIQAVVETVRREICDTSQQTLFVFGAYGIGKERVFMAVAQALGLKVHVDGSRWKAMMCYDWRVEEKSRLSTDSTSTPLWVVSMSQINFKSLNELRNKANSSKGTKKSGSAKAVGTNPTFSRVVGFQPTGWTHKPGGRSGCSSSSSNESGTSLVTCRNKGQDTIYSVPYSEHSSFSELISFVDTFTPQRIIPTVNTQRDKVKAQLALIKEHSTAYGSSS